MNQDTVFEITDREFFAIQEIMYKATGVRLTPAKKNLAFYRLRPRLKHLKIDRFAHYVELLKNPDGKEMEVFINIITTNETFFYRHPVQFDRLVRDVLPDLMERRKAGDMKKIRIWSAACSTGEEPYSIAIACKTYFHKSPGWDFVIYASDINSRVLEFSRKACYAERSVEQMPGHLRHLFFTSEKIGDGGRKRSIYQLNRDVAQTVTFMKHNLLDPFSFKYFDIIFLRNVMIYFDGRSKQRVISVLEDRLNDGGYLFVSLTENLLNLSGAMRHTGNSIYKKDRAGARPRKIYD